jgi:NAD(P)-dependent dehydrogenase (short-subunit alcohol dehydrogenase family)
VSSKVTVPYRRPGDVPEFLDLLRLGGRSIVVLGGGAGIGRQAVHALVQAGADVVCIDRESHLAKAVAQEAGCHALTADATSRDDLARPWTKQPG